jgi:cytochrome c-type biogenesis protein
VNGPLVYAFGVGMVATFNPCGFAMLPAYVSYFLGLEDAEHPDERDTLRTVIRALTVGLVMTLGFVVVFGLIGTVLDPVISRVFDRLPWVTIALGLGLVGLGVFMLAGRTVTVNLPKLTKGTDSRELGSVFLFGISYALVSLSCTLPLFTAAVSVTARGESVFVEVGTHVAYALGMGLVLMVLTLAIALARSSLVHRMRGVLPYVNRISGGLLVVAGLYVAYYGWYELRVYDGDTSGGGVARWMFDLSARMTNWVESVGPVRLGLVLALAIALVVLIVLARRPADDDTEPGESRPATADRRPGRA